MTPMAVWYMLKDTWLPQNCVNSLESRVCPGRELHWPMIITTWLRVEVRNICTMSVGYNACNINFIKIWSAQVVAITTSINYKCVHLGIRHIHEYCNNVNYRPIKVSLTRQLTLGSYRTQYLIVEYPVKWGGLFLNILD